MRPHTSGYGKNTLGGEHSIQIMNNKTAVIIAGIPKQNDKPTRYDNEKKRNKLLRESNIIKQTSIVSE